MAVVSPPLVHKLNHTSRGITSVGEALEIAKRFALDDPTPESDDEDHKSHRSNGNEGGGNSRSNGSRYNGKLRSDGHPDLVTTSGYDNRARDDGGFRGNGKSTRRDYHGNMDNSAPRPRFDANVLLHEPCTLHSRLDQPATHTTANCQTLKEI